MVSDKLLDKKLQAEIAQIEAETERSKALTREVESRVKVNELEAERIKKENWKR